MSRDELKTVRTEFPISVKRAAYERSGGKCESCGKYVDHPEYDHIIPCGFDGSNDLDNCQVLCTDCHKKKTREDVRAIAKSKRIRRKHYGIGRERKWRRIIPGSKESGWKKKADGTWVKRT